MCDLLLGRVVDRWANYNLPKMAEPRAQSGLEALERAQEHQAQASPVERALITRWRSVIKDRRRSTRLGGSGPDGLCEA